MAENTDDYHVVFQVRLDDAPELKPLKPLPPLPAPPPRQDVAGPVVKCMVAALIATAAIGTAVAVFDALARLGGNR